MIQINRKTESFFDALSDCGGLMRALYNIGMFLINPYTLYALKAHIALHLIKFVPSAAKTKNIDE